MKKLFVFLSLALSALSSHSQSFQEWWNQKETQQKYLAEQIAAFQAYGMVLKEGYEVVSQGLGLVRNIQNEDFNQQESHFNSFSSINPHLRNSPETEQTSRLYSAISQLTPHIPNRLFPQFHYTEAEEKFILRVARALQDEGDQLLENQQILLSQGQLELTDTGRMDQLIDIQSQTEEIHAFLLQFIQDCQSLGYARKAAEQDLRLRKKIHFPQNQ